MELGFAEQVVYHDEFAKFHVPGHPGNGPFIAGPTLLRYGNDDQKQRYLPAMLRGDEVWAQGFSEPGAGSDLQSLSTRARRDGDDYIVSGTKLWSTYADVADMMFALVRTGAPDSGAAGISYLLIDMHAPGVTRASVAGYEWAQPLLSRCSSTTSECPWPTGSVRRTRVGSWRGPRWATSEPRARCCTRRHTVAG